MGRALRFFSSASLFCSAASCRRAPRVPALERGAAITEPFALRELDRGRLAAGADDVAGQMADTVPLTSGRLFALPSMAAVRKALDGEFDRYVASA